MISALFDIVSAVSKAGPCGWYRAAPSLNVERVFTKQRIAFFTNAESASPHDTDFSQGGEG